MLKIMRKYLIITLFVSLSAVAQTEQRKVEFSELRTDLIKKQIEIIKLVKKATKGRILKSITKKISN